jgi:hypothetical protein
MPSCTSPTSEGGRVCRGPLDLIVSCRRTSIAVIFCGCKYVVKKYMVVCRSVAASTKLVAWVRSRLEFRGAVLAEAARMPVRELLREAQSHLGKLGP